MKFKLTQLAEVVKKIDVMVWVPVAIIVVCVVTYIKYQMDLAPVNSRNNTPIGFNISKGDTSADIAIKLQSSGLIRSKSGFIFYVQLHGLRSRLKSGYYLLSQSQSAREIAKVLVSGRVANKSLLIPEGATLSQIKKLVAERGISEQSFDQALTEQSADFLQSAQAIGSLEGYLFPDTYSLTDSTKSTDLVKTMLANFRRKVVTPDIRAGLAAQGLNLHQGLTLASIVEKEVSNTEDRAKVAQVFLRRLKIGMRLESDVTFFYAGANSPFDTYNVDGLPAGPICNPGLGALRAVISPASTSYIYFVSDKRGKTYFSYTFAEHQANIQKAEQVK